MKKIIFILAITTVLFSILPTFANETYDVQFIVTPFISKVTGAHDPETFQYQLSSGDSVKVDLQVMEVNITVTEHGQKLAFSFDKELELAANGVTAPVTNIVMDAGSTAHLRTPTMDAGAELEISWPSSAQEQDIDPGYQALISQVEDVLAGNSTDDADNFSIIFKWLAGTDEAKNAGYYLTDLDNDGTPELLFGENQSYSNSTIFYDLYTLQNGQIVHVFDGWDRSRYYLTENGLIAHEGSSSAFLSFQSYNSYQNGELVLIQSIIYDSDTNPDNPWWVSYSSEFDTSQPRTQISESEVQKMQEQNQYQTVALEPFVK